MAKYLTDEAAAARAPPARSYQREGKRKYTKVSAEGAWDIMERSRNARVSLRAALLVCSASAELGCSEFADAIWRQQMQAMYADNSSLLFSVAGVWRLHFVAMHKSLHL